MVTTLCWPPTANLNRGLRTLLLLLLLAFAAVLARACARTLGRTLARDLEEVQETLETVDSGSAREGFDAGRYAELDEVAQASSDIVERLARREIERLAVEVERRELLASISHDLRTPLTSLRLLADAIPDELDQEVRLRYLRHLGTNVNPLSALVDDLFELARLEAGELRWSMRPWPSTTSSRRSWRPSSRPPRPSTSPWARTSRAISRGPRPRRSFSARFPRVGLKSRQRLQLGLRGGHVLHDPVGVADEGAAGLGQPDRVVAALQEPRAALALERGEVLGDR